MNASSKLMYSSGALASSVENAAVVALLLIFYNQAVGLPPATTSAIIFVAVLCDALFDPLIGQVSDNFRSRWGRRHPFMYASAIPITVLFLLLWNPPAGWSDQALAIYLLVCLVGIRFFDTFFELPALSLLPELFPDYDERARITTIRQAFSTLGFLAVVVLAYQVFLKENPNGAGGVTSREGYRGLSIVLAFVMFGSIMACALGTHGRIPHLRSAERRTIGLGVMLREAALTLNNRSYIAITASGVISAIAFGMRGGLSIYFSLYFFELSQSQLAMLAMLGGGCTWIGLAVGPALVRRFGKRAIAIVCLTPAVVIGNMTIILRLMGVAPENGSQLLFVLLCAETIICTILAGAMMVAQQSMIVDVVEDAEVRTGRRSEGLLLSANSLINKMVSGLGTFLSGAILAFVAFPDKAERGQVDPEILHDLGMLVVPASLVLLILSVLPLFYMSITRKTHEENLRTIRERAG